MFFDVKAQGNNSARHRRHIKKLKSPGILLSTSSISKTIILPSDPREIRDRLKLIIQKKQAGNNSDIINDEIVAVIDKLLEYKCIFKKTI